MAITIPLKKKTTVVPVPMQRAAETPKLVLAEGSYVMGTAPTLATYLLFAAPNVTGGVDITEKVLATMANGKPVKDIAAVGEMIESAEFKALFDQAYAAKKAAQAAKEEAEATEAAAKKKHEDKARQDAAIEAAAMLTEALGSDFGAFCALYLKAHQYPHGHFYNALKTTVAAGEIEKAEGHGA